MFSLILDLGSSLCLLRAFREANLLTMCIAYVLLFSLSSAGMARLISSIRCKLFFDFWQAIIMYKYQTFVQLCFDYTISILVEVMKCHFYYVYNQKFTVHLSFLLLELQGTLSFLLVVVVVYAYCGCPTPRTMV